MAREVEVPVRVRAELEIRVRIGDQAYELGTAEIDGGTRANLGDALADVLRELADALAKACREPVPDDG